MIQDDQDESAYIKILKQISIYLPNSICSYSIKYLQENAFFVDLEKSEIFQYGRPQNVCYSVNSQQTGAVKLFRIAVKFFQFDVMFCSEKPLGVK